VQLYGPGDATHSYTRLVCPQVTITPGAFRVHGISQADVAEAPLFNELADEIEALFVGCDVILGYNVRFDIRFLEQEFARIGRKVDLSGKLVIDPFRIWSAMEPRRLENAVSRFTGKKLEDAHSAEADAQAVIEVLDGMRAAFGLDDTSWAELAELTAPERHLWIGPSNHVRWEGETAVIGFGKYDGRSVVEIALSDPGYLRWIQSKDFPPHVNSICKGALSGISHDAFHDRLAKFYGRPVVEPVPAQEAAGAADPT
jgi:DNA polymerase-3 subunit epsilon